MTVHRLEELGLREGRVLQMLQPGSPCIIRLAGIKLCFRSDDLTSVLVKPTATVREGLAVAPGTPS